MLEGTQKLFPTGFTDFKQAMLEAAAEDKLPIVLELDNPIGFTLKDFQDMFNDFKDETGLDITGCLFTCDECGRLHTTIEVDYLDEEEGFVLE